MRVLGVDPGLTRCGLGVVDGRPGKAAMVAVGVVRAEQAEQLVQARQNADRPIAYDFMPVSDLPIAKE